MTACDDRVRWSVRAGKLTDADVLCAFNASMALETEGRALDADVLRRGVLGALGDPARARYFVAERDARIAGMLMLTAEWSDWRAGEWWWIQSVYVQEDTRRTGAYRALHEHVRELALHASGVVGLRLYVERANAKAKETYRSIGMEDAHYEVYEQAFPP